MLSTKRARRLSIAYVALIVLSLLLLAFSSSGPMLDLRRGVGFALAPVQEGLRGAARSVNSFFATFAEIERLRAVSEQLERRLAELEAANRQLESVRIQNEQLSALLGVRSSLAHETVAAEVISRVNSQLERGISLDRGSDDGVALGDAVIAGGGALVGQVVEVGATYSRVQLLSDSRMTVVGMTETSRATGEVRGQLDRPLQMERILATEEVEPGESVVTAGIDLGEGIRSPFPRGLLIGTIVDVQRPPNQVLQVALLQPATPLDRLEYVLVITDYEGGMPIVPVEPTLPPAP
ncbi:MAG TPA: rod shape-determining protein MreC [Candidatus Limnocylindria bacterium]|nr:rod shape-determining protein MreC [Candidatus Limnocylindria bacterium]